MSKNSRALLFNVLAIFCWAISPIAIRYIKEFFPVNFQNFFRYFVSLFIIWPVFLVSHSRAEVQEHLRKLPTLLGKFFLIACINYIFQLSFTYSFFLLYPGFGVLIYKMGVIFSVFLAAAFFPDERNALKNRLFQSGLLLAFIGVILTIIGSQDFGHVEFNLGIVLILLAAAAWSLLTALVKKWLPGIPASFSVSVVLTIVTPLYLLTDIVMNRGIRLPEAPLSAWLFMIISGFIGVGIAHSSYYHSVPVLGVALCASLDLSRPFIAGLLSFLIFGESLTVWQIIGGLLLLFGSYLVIRIRFQSKP